MFSAFVSEIDFLDDADAVTNLSCIWEIGRCKGRERKTVPPNPNCL